MVLTGKKNPKAYLPVLIYGRKKCVAWFRQKPEGLQHLMPYYSISIPWCSIIMMMMMHSSVCIFPYRCFLLEEQHASDERKKSYSRSENISNTLEKSLCKVKSTKKKLRMYITYIFIFNCMNKNGRGCTAAAS